MERYLTAALYKFVHLDDYESLRAPLLNLCDSVSVIGKLILASEGINGTISGPPAGVRTVLRFLRDDPRLESLEHKESWTDGYNPMVGMKVLLRKEIVTMGVEGVDPLERVGEYVEPQLWNTLIAEPNVLLIDTRNTYETNIGSFHGAIPPATETFAEFPAWVEANRSALEDADKIAMYCTGGIRCERATSYLLAQGFENVLHLKGGVLRYLEEIPEAESMWRGECFVFDGRVSVVHGVRPGSYSRCRGCRHPIQEIDKASPLFEDGVCCPHCHDRITTAQKERFRERRRQVSLATARGESHLFENTGCNEKKRLNEPLTHSHRPPEAD